MLILPLRSQELDLFCRSLDLALFYGKISLQKGLDYSSPFSNTFLRCVAQHNDVVSV